MAPSPGVAPGAPPAAPSSAAAQLFGKRQGAAAVLLLTFLSLHAAREDSNLVGSGFHAFYPAAARCLCSFVNRCVIVVVIAQVADSREEVSREEVVLADFTPAPSDSF